MYNSFLFGVMFMKVLHFQPKYFQIDVFMFLSLVVRPIASVAASVFVFVLRIFLLLLRRKQVTLFEPSADCHPWP